MHRQPTTAANDWGSRPDDEIPPGEHLAEILEELRMSQSDLARRMGRPVQAVNEIIRGVKAITAETALQLEDVLGFSAETWMTLETNYRLTKARMARKNKMATVPAETSRGKRRAAATKR